MESDNLINKENKMDEDSKIDASTDDYSDFVSINAKKNLTPVCCC